MRPIYFFTLGALAFPLKECIYGDGREVILLDKATKACLDAINDYCNEKVMKIHVGEDVSQVSKLKCDVEIFLPDSNKVRTLSEYRNIRKLTLGLGQRTKTLQRLNSDSAKAIARIRGLEHLKLDDVQLTERLRFPNSLKILEIIQYNAKSTFDLRHIQHLSLETLILKRTFGDFRITGSQLPDVKHLFVVSYHSKVPTLPLILPQNVETLTTSFNFKDYPMSLRKLTIFKNDIDDAFLDEFKPNPGPPELVIKGTFIHGELFLKIPPGSKKLSVTGKILFLTYTNGYEETHLEELKIGYMRQASYPVLQLIKHSPKLRKVELSESYRESMNGIPQKIQVAYF